MKGKFGEVYEEEEPKFNLALAYLLELHKKLIKTSAFSEAGDIQNFYFSLQEAIDHVLPLMKKRREKRQRFVAELNGISRLLSKARSSKSAKHRNGLIGLAYNRLRQLRLDLLDEIEELKLLMPKYEVGKDLYDAFVKGL